jgi:hypothetical protein
MENTSHSAIIHSDSDFRIPVFRNKEFPAPNCRRAKIGFIRQDSHIGRYGGKRAEALQACAGWPRIIVTFSLGSDVIGRLAILPIHSHSVGTCASHDEIAAIISLSHVDMSKLGDRPDICLTGRE